MGGALLDYAVGPFFPTFAADPRIEILMTIIGAYAVGYWFRDLPNVTIE
jgi:hypothetical protein